VPLGDSAAASVFLATSDVPPFRLLRLKRWKQAAPPAFLERFGHLRVWLEDWAEPSVPPLLAATLDGAGCPSVVSEFRQGTPMIDCVGSGRVDTREAMRLLDDLQKVIVRAHAMGRVHGSIVPGNIIVQPGLTTAHLLDFGLDALVSESPSPLHSPHTDLAGFAAIAQLVGMTASRPPQAPL